MKKIHLSQVSSTNSYLKENYQSLDNFTFVSSDKQTSGRGRNNRQWKSENGKNLLFSLLILSKDLIKKYKDISLVTAVSICEVLEELNIKGVSIKWPNDVYVNSKKICGILLEAVTKEDIECLIIGVGLNVNQKEYVGEYLTTPTSIINETNKEFNINELKDKVYTRLIDNLNLIKDKDFYSYVTSHDYLKDKYAYAEIDDEKKRIEVKGIDKDFTLKIIVDGSEKSIETGEITFHV